MRRALLVLMGCVVVAVGLTGVSSAVVGNSGSPRLKLCPDSEPDYPASWSEFVPTVQPTIGSYLVSLSNQTMHDPCTTATQDDGSVSHSCDGWPVEALRPGGVFVNWRSGDAWFPLTPEELPSYLARLPGRRIEVDGQPAKVWVDVRGDDSCGGLDSTRVIGAAIVVDGQVVFQMQACFATRSQACPTRGSDPRHAPRNPIRQHRDHEAIAASDATR